VLQVGTLAPEPPRLCTEIRNVGERPVTLEHHFFIHPGGLRCESDRLKGESAAINTRFPGTVDPGTALYVYHSSAVFAQDLVRHGHHGPVRVVVEVQDATLRTYEHTSEAILNVDYLTEGTTPVDWMRSIGDGIFLRKYLAIDPGMSDGEIESILQNDPERFTRVMRGEVAALERPGTR